MSSDKLAKKFEDLPQSPEVMAMLLRGDLPPAKCRALIEGDRVIVYPSDESIVGTSLPQPIKLSMLDTGDVLNLQQFRWHECGTHGNGKISK